MSFSPSPWDLPPPPNSDSYSNLQCFFESVSPVVPTQLLPKKTTPNTNGLLRSMQVEMTMAEGFTLRDFWRCYTEWSAYGADVPLVLDNGERIVQYYNPSLSAMQIFTHNDLSSSLGGSGKDNMAEKPKLKGVSRHGEKAPEVDRKMKSPLGESSSSSSNAEEAEQPGASLEKKDGFGYLYFQYNELLSPYERVPLSVKINQLARTHPGLMELRSIDLTHYSWVAIAWYPVYQIPAVKNLKDLAACFLTYHPLKASAQVPPVETLEENKQPESKGSKENEKPAGSKGKKEKRAKEKKTERKLEGLMMKKIEACLAPFAAAAYKLNGTVWLKPEGTDQERLASHQTAAASWLHEVKFFHSDFNFFMSSQCRQ